MTRLISGIAGGRRLKVPAAGVRPTGDRAREGLFNSLSTLLDLDGARVLDLYAGSGALGLEALSRGAAEAVVVVERSSREEPWEWPTPLTGVRDRRYGEAVLRYGRAP